MKKKSKGIKIIAIVLLVAVLLFLSFLVYNFFNNLTPEAREDKANSKLNQLGGIFYEHYYEDLEKEEKDNTKKVLADYKDIGLTINVKDLQIYLDQFKIEDYSAFDKCEKQNTKVTVFPIEPYEKTDYNVRVILDCKF